MDQNAYLEVNVSQKPAIALLQSMGYTYISPEDCEKQRGSRYHVLLKDILRGQLRRLNRYSYAGAENEFSAANIERAMEELDEPLTDGLVRTSEKIYDALLLGKSYPETVGGGKSLSFNLKYIDWEHPENNLFHVTEEFAVESQDKLHNARPDIVLFINGIPFAVIECKAPHISVDQAVEQIIRNQQADYIPQLFKYAQIVMATNKNAVKYATAGTPKKFWSVWKEQDTAFLDSRLAQLVADRAPTEQDRNIISLFSRERLMELTRYFVLFDANVKKICRYQQYFAIREIIKTIAQQDSKGNRQSGVIWHTQGSGKSLTMVMLAKYILMELAVYNPRVVIVTDRKELDGQIAATFAHTRLNPARATSGRHLVELVTNGKADVITTIINKSEAVKKAKKENPDPTPKEKKEISAEEKEMKSKRKQIQEKLIKFATRIPVFMYLTDYRERCLKDVITQLEPGLFKKVTGLSVEDFNMLCSLGVFNAPLMNDAIFKFKRYEDASLTYTGLDKHADDEVGGWDTTIRKTQYEKLFYNQQSSMNEVDYSAYSRSSETTEDKRAEQHRTAIKVESPKSTSIVQPQPARSAAHSTPTSSAAPNIAEIDLKTQLEALAVDSTVIHKKFGKGTVVKINKNEKFIHIRFTLGEKKFIFPDAFLMGFLESR